MLLAYSGKRLMRGCSLTQSCLTLCKSVDCSRPDSSVYGILQARILEWVASFGSHEWVRLLSPTGHVHKAPQSRRGGRRLVRQGPRAACTFRMERSSQPQSRPPVSVFQSRAWPLCSAGKSGSSRLEKFKVFLFVWYFWQRKSPHLCIVRPLPSPSSPLHAPSSLEVLYCSHSSSSWPCASCLFIVMTPQIRYSLGLFF